METAACYAAVSAAHMNTKMLITAISTMQPAPQRIAPAAQVIQETEDIRKHPMPYAALKAAAMTISLSASIFFPARKNSFPVTRNGSAGVGHTPRTTNSPTAGTGKCISCDVSMHLTVTVPCVLCSAGRSLWPLTSMKTASFA